MSCLAGSLAKREEVELRVFLLGVRFDLLDHRHDATRRLIARSRRPRPCGVNRKGLGLKAEGDSDWDSRARVRAARRRSRLRCVKPGDAGPAP